MNIPTQATKRLNGQALESLDAHYDPTQVAKLKALNDDTVPLSLLELRDALIELANYLLPFHRHNP